MLYMEKKDKLILWNIIKQFPKYTFYAFGSRTKGDNRKFSDLDILVNSSLTANDYIILTDLLHNSDLPFKVDIIEKQNCKKDFLQSIEKNLVLLNKISLGIL